MARLLVIVLVFAQATFIPPAAPRAMQSNHTFFDLAVDPAGRPWLATARGRLIALSLWKDRQWRPITEHQADGTVSSLRIAGRRGMPLAAWIETASAAREAGITIWYHTSRGEALLQPEELRGAFRSFDLASLDGDSVGIAAVALSPHPVVRWCEYDPAGAGTLRTFDLEVEGKPAHPVAQAAKDAGSGVWLAWEERRRSRLAIAAVNIVAGGPGQTIRFEVAGFGGRAVPVLREDRAGRVVIVWQESTGQHGSVLMSRTLGAAGAGEARALPLPPGIVGAISPGRAAGSDTALRATAWTGSRWGAALCDLAESRNPEISLRLDDREHILSPQLAIARDGAEVWTWPSEQGAAGPLTTRTGDELARDEVESRPARTADEGVTRVLAFGDSITEGKEVTPDREMWWLTPGYTSYLADVYSTKVAPIEVIQSGLGGEDTPSGLLRLPSVLGENPGCAYVLILHGTNDVWLADFDPEVSSANVGKMADIAREAGAVPVLATLLPRFDSDEWARLAAEEISAAVKPVARLRGATVCDFQALFPKDLELFSDRRLHPNQEGYKLMADLWFSALLTFLGDVDRSAAVDSNDLLRLSAVSGTRRGTYRFNPDADFNDDGHVDGKDLAYLLSRLGTKYQ